ncbi:MAG: ribosome small subunit-dependent GTPase A [Lachnospiraceae bacterium]|nr:ribosome small subunit-dependent GTPase A [Robinsoniella sp.]MDY3767215.1 ribosome small subunit-dependent GTPase A [Lachnospiraceae bacterium]
MQGKIIKGISGFYYVDVIGSGIYECKAKGIFRKEKRKPLVGDRVTIDVLDEEKKTGNLIEIGERKNTLIRPAVANVDQALVIFAISKPSPNLGLLDRFLVTMARQNLSTIICFNKVDLPEDCSDLQRIYAESGCRVIFTSTKTGEGIEEIKELLKGKTTTVAGPSGVGKSSMINQLHPHAQMEVGEVSKKIDRGKHTTRHSELFRIDEDTYLIDTPGFSSLYLEDLEAEELKNYFHEFAQYEQNCRFLGCVHAKEPDCAVKEAMAQGKISKERYESYISLYQELKEKRRY